MSHVFPHNFWALKKVKTTWVSRNKQINEIEKIKRAANRQRAYYQKKKINKINNTSEKLPTENCLGSGIPHPSGWCPKWMDRLWMWMWM